MKPSLQNKLYELLEFAKEKGLVEITWQENGSKISFKRGNGFAAPVSAPTGTPGQAQSAGNEPVFVTSPIVGTFRRSLAKNRPPKVVKGNKIKPGDRLGMVECMKIPTEVISTAKGEIKEILVEDGQTVEYGQPLFAVVVNEHSRNGKH